MPPERINKVAGVEGIVPTSDVLATGREPPVRRRVLVAPVVAPCSTHNCKNNTGRLAPTPPHPVHPPPIIVVTSMTVAMTSSTAKTMERFKVKHFHFQSTSHTLPCLRPPRSLPGNATVISFQSWKYFINNKLAHSVPSRIYSYFGDYGE
jgi:hypothetical protein